MQSNEKYKRREGKSAKEIERNAGNSKELIKLVEQLDELAIRIISLLGWIYILVSLIK